MVAGDLTNEVYNSINRYFSILSHTGYKSYNQVEQLLMAIFIENILYGDMSQFVTEADYNSIMNALYCIYGNSCLIPFPDYKKSVERVVPKLINKHRITESGRLRGTESPDLRAKS